MVPFSFAIAPDRSIWMLDEVKRRVAHYSSGGRFLGAVGGFRFDRFHAHPRDLAFAGRRLITLEQGPGDLHGIVSVVAHGGLRRRRITYGGRTVVVGDLVTTRGPVVGFLSGRISSGISRHPHGFAVLDVPGRGGAHLLPGQPLGDGTWMRLTRARKQDLDVRYIASQRRIVRPLRIELIAHGRRIPGFLGPELETSLRHGIVAYVRAAPVRSRDLRYGDGRWLLEISDNGSPLLWERLPDPPLDDETVVRHLTVGPNESLYMMVPGRRVVNIYRR